MPLTLFGLDGEMSAADLAAGGRLIQIGVTAHPGDRPLETGDTFAMILNPGDMTWDDGAEAVHGFTRQQIEDAAPAADVDALLEAWLLGKGASAKKRTNTIAVGFNVGSFDLPHLAAVLPRSAAVFSRRTLDINAVCFTLDGAVLNGQPTGWSGWKKAATGYARSVLAAMSAGGAAHDAGYDAQLHLLAWQYLQAACRGRDLPVSETIVADPPVQRAANRLLKVYTAEQVAEKTGVPAAFVSGWAAGGRATRADWIVALLKASPE
jgi:DNA polymerase III epsilon subunit-like protein